MPCGVRVRRCTRTRLDTQDEICYREGASKLSSTLIVHLKLPRGPSKEGGSFLIDIEIEKIYIGSLTDTYSVDRREL